MLVRHDREALALRRLPLRLSLAVVLVPLACDPVQLLDLRVRVKQDGRPVAGAVVAQLYGHDTVQLTGADGSARVQADEGRVRDPTADPIVIVAEGRPPRIVRGGRDYKAKQKGWATVTNSAEVEVDVAKDGPEQRAPMRCEDATCTMEAKAAPGEQCSRVLVVPRSPPGRPRVITNSPAEIVESEFRFQTPHENGVSYSAVLVCQDGTTGAERFVVGEGR